MSLENLFLPFLYILIPFFSIIIPLAFLFGALITFTRLSADGELTALLAAGQTLTNLARPVLGCALAVGTLGMFCSLYLEPWAERSLQAFTYEKAQVQLDNFIKVNMKPGVFTDGFLGYVFYSETMNADKSRMANVIIAPGQQQRNQRFTIFAPRGGLQGSVQKGDLLLNLERGTIYNYKGGDDTLEILKFDTMQLDLLRLFKQRIFKNKKFDRDYDQLYPRELSKHVDEAKKEWRNALEEKHIESNVTLKKLASRYYKSSYLLQQRFATAFLALGFGLLGMFLGIQDQRNAKSQAYSGIMLTITLSYAVLIGGRWMGQQGAAPASIASWAPPILVLLVGLWLVQRRNRLPLSEPTFACARF